MKAEDPLDPLDPLLAWVGEERLSPLQTFFLVPALMDD